MNFNAFLNIIFVIEPVEKLRMDVGPENLWGPVVAKSVTLLIRPYGHYYCAHAESSAVRRHRLLQLFPRIYLHHRHRRRCRRPGHSHLQQ